MKRITCNGMRKQSGTGEMGGEVYLAGSETPPEKPDRPDRLERPVSGDLLFCMVGAADERA